MLRDGGYPFLAPDNMGRPHEMVVTYMGEVIGGYAVGFEQHLVDYVLGHLYLASDNVVEYYLFILAALRTQAKHPRLALGEIFLYLLKAEVAALGPFAEVAPDESVALCLLLADGGKLVRRAEAGVGEAFLHKALCDGLIYLGSVALGVGAVVALLGAEAGHALVKGDSEVVEAVDDGGNARRLSHAFCRYPQFSGRQRRRRSGGENVHKSAEKAADMKIACGRWGETGHPRTLGKLTLRIKGFIILGGLVYVRKKKLRQIFVLIQKDTRSVSAGRLPL